MKRIATWKEFEVLQDKHFTLDEFKKLLERCKKVVCEELSKYENVEFKHFSFDTDYDLQGFEKEGLRATLSLCFERDETKTETDKRLIREAENLESMKNYKAEQEAREVLSLKAQENYERETYERLKKKFEK